MKRKPIPFLAAVCLSLAAGMANAAEPMQLTEMQMEAVSAGQTSIASGSASVLLGTAMSSATTYAYSNGPVRITGAQALSLATGFGAAATAAAYSKR